MEDVRLVPIQDVHLHERYDPARVKPLKEDILASKVLRDPPIAAIHAGRYIILDGATRTTALREIGVKNIAVQVVPYAQPQVTLDCWYHIVQGVSAEHLHEAICLATGASYNQKSNNDIQTALAAGKAPFALLPETGCGTIYQMQTEGDSLCRVLNQVIDTYIEKFKVIRTTPHDAMEHAAGTPAPSCTVAYPCFTPDEVLSMGLNCRKLPAGITRHIVNGRVTDLMVPLERLIHPEPNMTCEFFCRPRGSEYRSRAPC